jgi:RsmE family RNA methyltransferase
MNLMLFDKPFESTRIESTDPRAQHLIKVLRVRVGSKVYIGFVNRLRASAEVSLIESDGAISLIVSSTEAAPIPLPVRLLLGLPRPHTAKRILFEAASMGVEDLHFFEAEYSEPSYAKSSLWTTNEWKERIRLGAEQSFGTHIPEVGMHSDLQSAISSLQGQGVHVALDNYEAEENLGKSIKQGSQSAVLALGPERGWSKVERDIFRKNSWKLAHIGPQVLRLETACTAAVAVVSTTLGFYDTQTSTVI